MRSRRLQKLTVATNAKQLNLDEVEAVFGQLGSLNYRTVRCTFY